MIETSGFMRHVRACTHHNLSLLMPFIVGGFSVGWVRREIGLFLGEEEGFEIQSDSLILAPPHDAFEPRTVALWKASCLLSDFHGVPLHGEIYPVLQKWGDESLARIDRAAIPWFGVKGHGVHVNGFVRRADGLYLWIAERATDRRIDPGKLDNMIGGGLPLGLSIAENLLKEAWEEAGLSPDIVKSAVVTGSLSYKVEKMKGLRNDTLFIFDLEMEEGVVPTNTDGEVGSFTLMPVQEVLALVRETDRFKFNCNLVLIDFFLRHNVITPDDSEYASLQTAMDALRA
ncbi:MAG: DUF4743 domain-containing protein [Bdellovibrionales bacterium]|jgi:8-oxo-dGTP pyrophosphatase MutT (NUDIX family)